MDLKDQKLGSGTSVKALDRSQGSTLHVGKVFDAPPLYQKTARKTLGTVNRSTEKSVKTNRNRTFFVKKVTEKT